MPKRLTTSTLKQKKGRGDKQRCRLYDRVYENYDSAVILRATNSENTTGIRQGCPSSPLWFHMGLSDYSKFSCINFQLYFMVMTWPYCVINPKNIVIKNQQISYLSFSFACKKLFHVKHNGGANRLHPSEIMNACMKFHGNLIKSCWDISVWTKVVDYP